MPEESGGVRPKHLIIAGAFIVVLTALILLSVPQTRCTLAVERGCDSCGLARILPNQVVTPHPDCQR